MAIARIDGDRLARTKVSFTTRRVRRDDAKTLLSGEIRPYSGDVVLARVDEIGKQTRLELDTGRRAFMFPGDEILVAYGNRYAPDQYEAMVGIDLAPCDLVAAGGVASVELVRSRKMITPTQITPIGLVGDAEGRRLNLMDYRVEAPETLPRIPAILSLGTSMNAGKSLTAASLVKGFKRLGHKVASLKITGTGSGGDMWINGDAGADVVLDFTDAGFASTYLTAIDDLERATYRLMNHAAAAGCEIAVIEIADGLQQNETRALVRSPAILRATLATMFSALDSMGALSGVSTLREIGHDLIGLSGRIGMTPLGVREAQSSTGLNYYSPWEAQDGVIVPLVRQRAAAKLKTRPDGMTAALTRLARALVDGSPNPDRSQAEQAKRLRAERVDRAARGALQLVVDFIVQDELKRKFGTAPAAGKAAKATQNRFEHRIWSSQLGLIHYLVPKRHNGVYRPRFLDQDLPCEFVLSLVESHGTPQCAAALHRLVVQLGGPDFSRADISALKAEVEEHCAELGVASALEEPEQPLTVDDLDPLFSEEDQVDDKVPMPVLGFEGMTGADGPMERRYEEETSDRSANYAS